MGTPADRAYRVAADVLDEVVAGLEAGGAGAPARRYVNDGALVAWDCEQVVVGVESIHGHTGELFSSDRPIDCLLMRAAVLTVWIVRCSPTMRDDGTPPSPAQIDASARAVLSDPLVALNAVVDAYRAGRVTDTHGLAFVESATVGPEGGYVGTATRFRVDLTTAVG